MLTPRRRLLGRARGRPRRLLARRRRPPRRRASRSATNARVGARSTLCPGAAIGEAAEVGAGSAVFGEVPAGEYWSGAPAARVAEARGPWSDDAPRQPARWIAGVRRLGPDHRPAAAAGRACAACWRCRPGCAAPRRSGARSGPRGHASRSATVVGLVVLALLVLVGVRLLAIGLEPGHHPVHGRARVAGLVHAAAARRGPGLALPALREHGDPALAARCWAPRSARTSRRRRCC